MMTIRTLIAQFIFSKFGVAVLGCTVISYRAVI